MREGTSRGIWKSQDQRERSRLAMASSLDRAMVFGRKGENNGGERSGEKTAREAGAEVRQHTADTAGL